jgi:arginyl-tRNA synthetase
MYFLDKIKSEIIEEVNKKLGSEIVENDDLAYPPNDDMGDLSLPLFKTAKATGKNPAMMAKDLTGIKLEAVSGISTAGPYLNFKLSKKYLSEGVLNEIEEQGKNYGKKEPEGGKKIMIEYSNANTHKEYHIGHLRNLCFGDAVSRLLSANGYESIPVSYINDFGIHVAKTLWAYMEYYKDAELPENKGEFLGQVYVRASTESKDNKTAKQLIEVIMKKIETCSGEEFDLWQKTRQWSIDQFSRIYDELGIEFEKIYYESEVIDEGREVVDDMIKKGILKVSQGAVIADLEEYGLGVLMFLRSDGTALYPVADTALARQKTKDFGPDESVYVTDIRQSLHFKQLFKVLELYGIKNKMTNLGYEFVKLPSGMMSSRSGNVITYAELRDELLDKAREETAARHEDWNERKIGATARAIAVGAMKFEMLKVGSGQIIVFDINKALSFSGHTAAYLQYTCARIKSIFRKAGEVGQKIDHGLLAEKEEAGLLLLMAKYPETVVRAGQYYDPSEIAKYLFELAQAINDYYHKIPVIKAENEDIRNARLALLSSAMRVMENGLELLGIETVEEM